jgi:hypothetical protein
MGLKKYSITNIALWVGYPLLLLAVCLFIFFTCTSKSTQQDKPAAEERLPVEREFRMVDVPVTIKTTEGQALYMVKNYWNNFDFADTACIRQPGIIEQAFVYFLDILPNTEKETVYASIWAMLTRCIQEDGTGEMYAYFLGLYKRYLYDPNSGMRNEDHYIPVTEYILNDTVSDEATRSRAEFDHKMMLKNRRGDIARNIEYTLSDGTRANLHSLGREYTILYFYNPDCHACKEMTAYMEASPVINGLLASGMLDILALYPDEDLALWRKYIPRIPGLWINAYDKGRSVWNKQLYDLKAIPCLYLLDKGKRVLLKDTDAIAIERFLYGSA